MVDNLFKTLNLDTWYKVLVYLGGIGFILSLFIPIPIAGVTNKQVISISLGMFFLGLGEWKNHKYLSWWEIPTVFAQTKIRKPDVIGIVFDIVGLLLLSVGLLDFLGIIAFL